MSNEPLGHFLAVVDRHCALHGAERARAEVHRLTNDLMDQGYENQELMKIILDFRAAFRDALANHYAKELAQDIAATVLVSPKHRQLAQDEAPAPTEQAHGG